MTAHSPTPTQRPDGAAGHDERLGVPLRWWVQGTMLVASLWLALVVATPALVAFGVAGLCLALLAGLLVAYGSAVVRVDDSTFRAGRASIAGHHLGRVDELDAEEARLVAGRDADARAYLLLRPYRKRAVRVEVLDPRDPAPYWLVSTRHPARLAAALRALVARTTDA
ncbi:DUF3093 domain-containing protein [Nocardioides sp. AX2bis]|uniref:DUF3093 domain-containing protein n=1 Tax=Nocardioides sp. AX2bis TaxID=2653157 RepID=UPI0012F39485|nr:DUF3093 domain-containing protein [Nocardioides sp. AX2bis]VXB46256.1 conserved hypothetical protein [Nocardioides sp. AX2bis]